MNSSGRFASRTQSHPGFTLMTGPFHSRLDPLFHGHPGVPQNPSNETGIDSAPMGIRNGDSQVSAAHPLVPAAGERSVEAQHLKFTHQFAPGYGIEPCHVRDPLVNPKWQDDDR